MDSGASLNNELGISFIESQLTSWFLLFFVCLHTVIPGHSRQMQNTIFPYSSTTPSGLFVLPCICRMHYY